MGGPSIVRGSDHFFATTYEGNGTAQKVGNFVPFTNNATVAKSCIFNLADNPKLSREVTTTGNRRTFTISAWCKFDQPDNNDYIFFAGESGHAYCRLYRSETDDNLAFHNTDAAGSNKMSVSTTRTLEDTSKYYHILVAVDTTQSTDSNKIKIYIDGVQETSFAYSNYTGGTNYDTEANKDNSFHFWGEAGHYSDAGLTGYLAECNLVDGTALTPSTFGLTDTSTGRWIPKTLTGITYGTNGCRCEFANSAGQTIGDDTSGQSNDFTVTNLVAGDITTDSPTQNFITFSPPRVYSTAPTLSEGNLKLVGASVGGYPKIGTGKTIPQSGKWYWEVKATTSGGYQGLANPSNGVIDTNLIDVPGLSSANFQHTRGGMGAMMETGFKFSGLLSTATDLTIGTSDMATGDYWLFAFDMNDGKAWWGWNDSSAGTSVVWFANDGGSDGNPATGANPTVTFNPKDHTFLPIQEWFAPSSYPATFEYNFGSKAFNFTAPSGFSGLSQNNFPETDKGVSGLVWTKNRDATDSHQLYDSSRGRRKVITSDAVTAEATVVDGLQTFLKGGQSIEDDVSINTSAESYVSWNWVGNSGTTATNDASATGVGSIDSTYQVNSDAGFSIVQYTGTGSAGTIKHGLSVAPSWIMVKNLSQGDAWKVYHSSMASDPETDYMVLNTDAAAVDDATVWNDTAPTSTVFSIGNHTDVNTNTENYVAYCWNTVDGFSKFFSYIGNGDANGPFVYTGFRPAWVMVKETGNANNWYIWDTKRSPMNPMNKRLVTEGNYAEVSDRIIDFLSNGYKIREGNIAHNRSAGTYVYMAFAEHPFVGDGTNPATAR